ncbi:glycoside hydrolase superfamily [Halenospora varia]|nr:glycoside hydrolase superfamily [Halenospora varia]
MRFSPIHALLASAAIYATNCVAGFTSSSSSNIAIYWGQNSINLASGPSAQKRLAYYCANTNANIIPIAFLTSLTNPTVNVANQGATCTMISEDIQVCQSQFNKTIILSLGGATYAEGGFTSSTQAISSAQQIFSIFGPPSSSSTARPFGNAIINGFDFDFESTVSNMVPFAQTLRSLMDSDIANSGREWILVAAPQCVYPDAADGEMLAGPVFFDAVFVQFYNNFCGTPGFVPGATTQTRFNIDVWDTWAKTISLNPNVKVFLGIPGSASAAGSGYVSGTALGQIIAFCKGFSSFGGVMIWDESQADANAGFLDSITGFLGIPASPAPAPTTTTTTRQPTTSITSIIPPQTGTNSITRTATSSASTSTETMTTTTESSKTPESTPSTAPATSTADVSRAAFITSNVTVPTSTMSTMSSTNSVLTTSTTKEFKPPFLNTTFARLPATTTRQNLSTFTTTTCTDEHLLTSIVFSQATVTLRISATSSSITNDAPTSTTVENAKIASTTLPSDDREFTTITTISSTITTTCTDDLPKPTNSAWVAMKMSTLMTITTPRTNATTTTAIATTMTDCDEISEPSHHQ